MRIQIFAQSLSTGGAERVASLWATGFVNQGYEVQFALMAGVDAPRTYPIPDSVSVVSANSSKKGFLKNFIGRFKHTGQLISRFNPDVIITVVHVQDLPIWFYTRGKEIKIIQTEHNSFERPSEAPMSKFEKFRKFYRNRLFDAVTVLTQADADVIGSRLKHVYVLPNPLAFEPVSNIPSKKKIILAVGRLDVYYTKGFDVLIKAFAKIQASYPDWKLRIVGSGKESSLNYLMGIAEKEGIERNLEFVPYTSDLRPLYQEAEIFCLSSRFEGFGMVLIEAMSQGCACIACDYKGRQKEIIKSEKYGVICKVDDTDELAKKISTLIDDESYRNLLKGNSPLRAKDYSLPIVMENWKSILNEL